MKDFVIRPMAESDIKAIVEIYNYYVSETTVSFETEPLTVAEMRSRIKHISAKHPCLVAVADNGAGQVLGYCYAHEWKERHAYCHTLEVTIYLDSEAKGCGVGAALMKRLIDECRQHGGCHALIACITAENAESIAFHSKMGFEAVSHFHQVGCKFGRWLDVVDMELIIPNRSFTT